jgi:hypothetical protein
MNHCNCCEPDCLLTKDAMLNDITLDWLTNTAIASARLYWENVYWRHPSPKPPLKFFRRLPRVAILVFYPKRHDVTAKPGRINEAHDGNH